jgi:hypothetical protein
MMRFFVCLTILVAATEAFRCSPIRRNPVVGHCMSASTDVETKIPLSPIATGDTSSILDAEPVPQSSSWIENVKSYAVLLVVPIGRLEP